MRHKIVFFVDSDWALGSIHHALVEQLNEKGWSTELCDWALPHGTDRFEPIEKGGFVVTLPYGGTRALLDSYHVAHERIIIVAHDEWDLINLVRHSGTEEFDRFAAYGVVSDNLACSSLALGIRRVPHVLRLGIKTARYRHPLPTALNEVGYGTVMSRTTVSGIERKRGELARVASERAGLCFRPAFGCRHTEMSAYYGEVQAVLMPSLQEGAGLPVLEAAAAGRLVIGTPVGHFQRLAYEGLGLLAPLDDSAFVDYCATALKFFKQNPSAFRDKTAQIRVAAQARDWRYVVGDWEAFLNL